MNSIASRPFKCCERPTSIDLDLLDDLSANYDLLGHDILKIHERFETYATLWALFYFVYMTRLLDVYSVPICWFTFTLKRQIET